MPIVYKVLAMSAPSATTNTTLYTVPASTSTIASSLIVCNQAASSATYRIAVRPAGAEITAQHYIAYDVTIAANSNTAYTLGLTLAATDVITVYSSSATLSFSLYGSEIS